MSDQDYRARCLTAGYLLLHAQDSDLHTAEEQQLVRAYRQAHDERIALEIQSRDLEKLRRESGFVPFGAIRGQHLAKKLRLCRERLSAFESDPRLQDLIRRERARAEQKFAEQQRELIEAIGQRKAQQKRAQLRAYHPAQAASAAAQKHRAAILDAMGLSECSITSTGRLALATVMAVRNAQRANRSSFVCRTNLASCDTVIYSAFLVREWVLKHAANDALAQHFTDRYFEHITAALGKLFPLDGVEPEAMLRSRILHYERALAERSPANRTEAANKRFELILKADALSGRYTAFGEKIPLPFLSRDADRACRTDIAGYRAVLLDTVQKDLQAVQEDLSR